MAERTISELHQLQGLPLEVKIQKTKQRIREWVDEFGVDGVYVSFSGGKDSTVLLTICRELYPDMKAVFVDTGLEYPEIRAFVRTWDNVDWVKPKMTFKEVIEKYGYPFISKEVAECVEGARKYLTAIAEQNSLDRPTDRPTDRHAPYAYRLSKLLGTGAYSTERRGHGNKVRKLVGYGQYCKPSVRQFQSAETFGVLAEDGQSDSGEYP